MISASIMTANMWKNRLKNVESDNRFYILQTTNKNIINFARVQRLGWYGHIERMQETRMVNAIHAWKPISKRPMGRSKIRWEDDVKKDIQRLKVPNWKTLVQDRRRWKEVVGKAKALH